MVTRLVFGNIISFISAVFLCFSCVSKKRKRIYMFQVFECIFLLFSQIIFGQGAAAASLFIAATRNFLLCIGKYTRISSIMIFIATLALGILFNTGGIVGFIPVIASLVYTVTTYYAKDYLKVKLSLLVNLAFWIMYSLLILDLSTFVVNIVSFVLNIISLFNIKKVEKY